MHIEEVSDKFTTTSMECSAGAVACTLFVTGVELCAESQHLRGRRGYARITFSQKPVGAQ